MQGKSNKSSKTHHVCQLVRSNTGLTNSRLHKFILASAIQDDLFYLQHAVVVVASSLQARPILSRWCAVDKVWQGSSAKSKQRPNNGIVNYVGQSKGRKKEQEGPEHIHKNEEVAISLLRRSFVGATCPVAACKPLLKKNQKSKILVKKKICLEV